MDENIGINRVTEKRCQSVPKEENSISNQMEISVSIIIPVYNGQYYISHCLESILNQTFEMFEVILVNDGSTDNSAEICEHFQKVDPRIRVIHKENGGVSSAREVGLKEAIGEYIAFVDVDDILHEQYLETLVHDALRYNADIVCCDCIETESGYGSKEINRFSTVQKYRLIEKCGTFDKKRSINNSGVEIYIDFFNATLSSPVKRNCEFYMSVVWGKIIRRNVALSENFTSIKYGEDLQYMMKLFSHDLTVYLTPYRGYTYIRWDLSATKKIEEKDSMRVRNAIEVAKTIYESATTIGAEQVVMLAEKWYAQTIYNALNAEVYNGDVTVFEQYREYMLQHINFVRRFQNISKKNYLMLNIYRVSPRIYWVVVGVILKRKYKL